MKSLRLRLVVALCIAIAVVWSTAAAWMFGSMRRELHNVLDDRLIASTRMVAGVVGQFSHAQTEASSQPGPLADLTSVIARDGVACEVSLVRGEVELLPLARTENSPGFAELHELGFGSITKGGKPWRTYVLEDNGIRITTADRMDVRDKLVQSFAYALILPFVLVLLGLLALTWWLATLGLQPLRQLQQVLAQRPPQDSTPIAVGQDIKELAPMVHSLNALLERTHEALEHERRWTADAAHELRTPLTAIKTHVQVTQLLVTREQQAPQTQHSPAEEGAATPALAQIQQSLIHVEQGISHMQDTLDQLLLLARVEGASSLTTQQLSGADVLLALERACEQSRRHAAAKGHDAPVQLHVQPSDTSVWQNCKLVLPVPLSLWICAVSNVVNNALRHTQPAQGIEVQLALDAGHSQLRLQVRDHGLGMTETECVQALKRFWRKSPSSQGAGLGLTIVQRIMDSAQGQLLLAPAPEGGLLVEIQLPVQRLDAAD